MLVVSGLLLEPREKGDLNSACDVEASVEAVLSVFFWMAVVEVRRAGSVWRPAPRTSEDAAREEMDMATVRYMQERQSASPMGGGRRRSGGGRGSGGGDG